MKEFKINLKCQLKSTKISWIMSFFSILGIFLILIIKHKEPFELLPSIIVFCFCMNIIIIAPIYLQYLIRNWNTKFIVNEKSIEIIEGKKRYKLNFGEFKTELVIGRMHSPTELFKIASPIENFGFVRIIAKNNIFIITSLMADPFNFPIQIDKTTYGVIFIGKYYSGKEIRAKKIDSVKSKQQKIAFFLESFESLKTSELKNKIENETLYCAEAIYAAKQLIQEREIKITPANSKHMKLLALSSP